MVRAEPKEVHGVIEKILKGWPGRTRGELWARLRQLKNGDRKAGVRHAVWNEEDIEILRTYYAQGLGGARRAVKELLVRHPDWSSRSIWHKAAKLGFRLGLKTANRGRLRSRAICAGTPARSRWEESRESWEEV